MKNINIENKNTKQVYDRDKTRVELGSDNEHNTKNQTPNPDYNQTWVLFHSDKTQTTELLKTILKNYGSSIEIKGILDRRGMEEICDEIQKLPVTTSHLSEQNKVNGYSEQTQIKVTPFIDIINKPQKSLMFSWIGNLSDKDREICEEMVRTYPNSEILIFHTFVPKHSNMRELQGVSIIRRGENGTDTHYYTFDPYRLLPLSERIEEKIPEYYKQIMYVNNMCEYTSYSTELNFYEQSLTEIERNPSLSEEWNITDSEIKDRIEQTVLLISRVKEQMDYKVLQKVTCKEDLLEICKI